MLYVSVSVMSSPQVGLVLLPISLGVGRVLDVMVSVMMLNKFNIDVIALKLLVMLHLLMFTMADPESFIM